ncbi:MAG: hypothetical protein AABZ65_02735 [Candidatus Omnitrophota bacterium]
MGQEKGFTPLEAMEQPGRNKMLLSGFTFLEVMISALLIMIGLGAFGVTVVAGKRFLKQAEYRSQAMGLATSKMEEYSARGYAVLSGNQSGREGFYNWTVSVVTRNTTNATIIPYRDMEVIVSYPEEDGRGGLDTKNIRLTNIVPYPTAHTASRAIPSSSAKVPFAIQNAKFILPNYQTVGQLRLKNDELEFATTKDIAVSYSVAADIDSTDDGAEIEPIDTIYSTCFYGNGTTTNATGVETRTPIKTQLSFNNMVVLKGVPPRGDNIIEVKWYYDRPTINQTTGNYEYTTGYANTNLTLRKAELSILATEVD